MSEIFHENILAEFKLSWVDDSGVSARSRLEQVWGQTGIKPKELDVERLPYELEYLRDIFWDLWNSEGWSWSELVSYEKLYGITLDETDIAFLRKTFSICLKFVRDKMKPKKAK